MSLPLSSLSALTLNGASLPLNREQLSSGIEALDEFLGGGLPFGTVCEWGVPFGGGGREVVAAFLAKLTASAQAEWALWIHSKPQLSICPPAWHARGVSLERIRFVCASKPVTELKPVFMDPFFKVIVLDAPRTFTDDDCAFLARQARAQNQLIIILRDFLLGARRGNVWARLRLNGWCPDPVNKPEHICLKIVRGLSSRQMPYELPNFVS